MDPQTLAIAFLTLVSWGTGSFIAKLATNRIGSRALFWDIFFHVIPVIIYCLIVFKLKNLLYADRGGIVLAAIAGLLGSVGLIGFYVLLTRNEASRVVPLTAVYPALTAILAFLFLKEKLTLIKGIGIVLATIAVYLLSI